MQASCLQPLTRYRFVAKIVVKQNLRIDIARQRHMSTHSSSTIDSGYILSLPKLPNPATTDPAYQRLLSWYLPKRLLDRLEPRLEQFGQAAVSDAINQWISNAERDPPYVKPRNIWGEKYPYDRLVTSEGWKQLGRWGISSGYFSTVCSMTYMSS